MNHQEFGVQMDRLKSQWKDAYGPERTKVIFKLVENITASRFAAVVSKLLSECRYAPLGPEIQEAIQFVQEKPSNVIPLADFRDWDRNWDCSFCKDNGVYVCKHVKTSGYYAFRCHCSRGLADPRTAIPHYRDVHSREYLWVDIAGRR